MNEHKVAGFWIRLGSIIIDGLLLIPLYLLCKLIGVSDIATEIFVNSINFLYYLIIPVIWSGFTVGKRVVGIKIVRTDGKKVGISTTLKRYILASLVYVITLGLAFIISAFMVGLRKDKRSIHDLIAGTQVIYTSKN
ncbi:RDD family protein [Fictibacillus sp. 7GRE50]|uniref:RDD family protein n=1 Tax=unclassified Fictibacillus TaxID=2644029 RepID=UPI0018CCC185|nr:MULTISPECIES: RDD family protein [unclassified Fictibacillus]MBH0167203.1 RDD family protein [Fictibacillus sp. 7GRE50]MBH0171511.1 RDD family protein [Fictibacillus sp. 18YEL24]